jgi:6-phosphogluconolactonase
MAASPQVSVHADPEALVDAVTSALVTRLTEVQATGRTPRVVLTGGGIADQLHARLASSVEAMDVDWGGVEFWFGDERYVDAWSGDRNCAQARRRFLDPVGADPDLVHEPPSSDSGLPLGDAVATYAQDFPDGPFDVVMLGMGPDGHTASLFPGRPEVHAMTDAVGVIESPKPPPLRLSMTVPRLSRAYEVWFLVSGEGKAEAAANALRDGASVEEVPASAPRGMENTIWWVDEAAASRL